MTARASGNWLKAYLEYVKELESPESFHVWTALSAIASVARRNVWIDQGHYLMYPNLFVILVAPPGKVAKSTSIRAGRRLVLGVPDIVFGPDSVTREDLIRTMSNLSKKLGPGKSSAMTIHSTELSSLIEQSKISMIQFLTDIYDCEWNPKGWRHSTKHQGKDVIYNPVLNLLAGTTPSWIAEGMPDGVHEHGFTARVVFIYEDRPRFLNPHPRPPYQPLVEALTEDLNRIAAINGEYQLTPEAWAAYDKYYYLVGESQPNDYRTEGFHWRKAKVHLLKVAMLAALSERDDLIIYPADIELAWDLLTTIEDKMYKTFSAVGKFEYASDMERIEAQVMESPDGLPIKEILTRNYAVGDEATLGKLIVTLQKMGRIKKVMRDGQSILLPATIGQVLPPPEAYLRSEEDQHQA
jgi:hypothetical protein